MATYNQEEIIRYVDNEMSAEEMRQIEADLSADEALAGSVALYREMKAALAERLPVDEGRSALLRTLGGMRGKYSGAEGLSAGGPAGVGIAGEAGKTAGMGDAGTAGAVDGAGKTTGMQGAGGYEATSAEGIGGGPRIRGDDSNAGAFSRPGQDDAGKTARVVAFRKYLAGIAAAAAVILAVVMLWPAGNGDLLEKLGGAQMVSGVERGEGSDSVMAQAAAYFNKKEFEKALPLLERVVAGDSANQEAMFYRGVTQLHTGAVAAARKDLEQVYAGQSLFRYEAAFYMGLSYAQQKDGVHAREWLSRVPDGAPGSEKARELEKEVK